MSGPNDRKRTNVSFGPYCNRSLSSSSFIIAFDAQYAAGRSNPRWRNVAKRSEGETRGLLCFGSEIHVPPRWHLSGYVLNLMSCSLRAANMMSADGVWQDSGRKDYRTTHPKVLIM